MPNRQTSISTSSLLLCTLLAFVRSLSAGEVAELPLLLEEDFESAELSDWLASDPHAWRFEEQDGNRVLSQFQQSDVQTPVRSPFNRAFVRGLVLTDFQMDVDLQSTARDYPHRSLCLFFGYQDPAHFYYVHLGQRADDHANQVFIVNEAPRTKISERSTEGTPWDNEWHHVRITRNVESGAIRVFFDDMEQPVMTATDTTFTWGEIGLGSFDDTGNFDNLAVHGDVR
jgi:hypothetical protein